MLFLKEMINSIFGTNPILFLLLQSLLTGLPLLPSMSQIILLKWGHELGASLQTFQVFHVFFSFFHQIFSNWTSKCHQAGPQNLSFQVLRAFPWFRQLNQLIYFTKVKRSSVELRCDSSNSWDIFTRTEYNSTFWDSKTFSQSIFPALSCVSE